MKRWYTQEGREVNRPAIDAFLQEIAQVCEHHGYSLAHEDPHGAFLIEKYSESNIRWLQAAHVNENE